MGSPSCLHVWFFWTMKVEENIDVRVVSACMSPLSDLAAFYTYIYLWNVSKKPARENEWS